MPGYSYADQAAVHGPSLAHESRRFRDVYGSERKLLDYQNNVLAHIPVITFDGVAPAVLPRRGP